MRRLILCLSVLVGALPLLPVWPGRAAAGTEALKKRVYAEFPQLRDETIDDFVRVTLLRQWAWSHVRVAATASNLLDGDPRTGWYKLDAGSMFQRFAEDRGGVFCMGTALALQRLYEAFGYTAWTVSSGTSGPRMTATHATTLVKIRAGKADAICLQDAYFNLTYVEAMTGRPLDYFDLVARLARGDHQSMRALESDHRRIPTCPAMILAAKDVGGRKPHDIAVASFPVLEDDYRVAKLPDGSLKFTSPRTLRKFVDRLCRTPEGKPAWYLAWLTEQGHPAELVYLYLYPFDLFGPESDALLRKAKAAAAPGQFPARGK